MAALQLPSAARPQTASTDPGSSRSPSSPASNSIPLLSLPPQATQQHNRAPPSLRRRTRTTTTRILKAEEYAKAVRGYSRLPTGAGQNHRALGEFLTSSPNVIDVHVSPLRSDEYVTLYPLILEGETPSPSPSPSPSLSAHKTSDHEGDPDSSDESRYDNRRFKKSEPFHDPYEFYRYNFGNARGDRRPQSCIVFLRGYMTAPWLNNIGARLFVDPEYFCRHLDFTPTEDSSNNFSIPALPSSSWHLISLPILTLGNRPLAAPKGPMRLDKIEDLRKNGAEAIADHHHRIAKLSSSGMKAGESMYRNYYVLDETHFAIEQRISICMQDAEDGSHFSLLVWLDAGTDSTSTVPYPWSVRAPESHLLPVIRHKHMVALKCHLFSSGNDDDADASARQAQSVANLPNDYGRSLRPSTAVQDAFYALTEIFRFVASSQMGFLNLIDTKLDKFVSQPTEQEHESLPHLKYTKNILYRHKQKTQQVIDSIRNARSGKWPRDNTKSGSRKARSAAESLEQDFEHLLARTETLHARTTEAITVLMSSISISESEKAILQAKRVGKLTFLAFIFVPLSFTTSFFGMNVKELADDKLSLGWWAVFSVPVLGAAVALFYLDVLGPFRWLYQKLFGTKNP